MGDLLSPSASMEANLVKVENTAGIHGGSHDKKGIIRRIREAIDPAGAASVYIDAAKVVAEGLPEIARNLIDSGTPEEYAAAQAYDIFRGAQKLTSVQKAIGFAEDCMEDGHQYTLPDDGFLRGFVSSAEDVGDEDALQMFGRILAGEMERPGSFSKRTMGILADMSKADAETFRDLCARSIGGPLGNGDWIDPIPMIVAPFEQFAIPQERLDHLNALGLTEINTERGIFIAESISFNSYGMAAIALDGSSYAIKKGTEDLILNIFHFTAFGKELARLCDLGCAEGFGDAVMSWIEESGAQISKVVGWEEDGRAHLAPMED